MRVLHAVHPFLRISENWIYPQVMNVPGVEPAVLTSRRENEGQFPTPDIRFIFDPPPWSIGVGLPRLVNSLCHRLGRGGVVAGVAAQRWRPDFIHAHFGFTGWDLLGLRGRLGVPLICSFYGMDAWQLPFSQPEWIDRYRQLFAEGTLFPVEGPAMRDRLVAIGCPVEKVRICRLGVTVENLPFTARPPCDPLRVVMIARFVEKKGFEDGLAACAEARKLGAELRVDIIGDGDGRDRAEGIKAELQRIASRPGCKSRVTFHGFLKPAEARAVIAASDVFLCPSKLSGNGDAEGGSPLALTEAMALGLLCIGTRHCDIPEVIRDGATGLLAEPGDVPGLAARSVRGVGPGRRDADFAASGARAHRHEFFRGPAIAGSARHLR